MPTICAPEVRPLGFTATTPVIFLAGPIIGAQDWQTNATSMIGDLDENILIASPRRRQTLKSLDALEHDAQVNWETEWLGVSARQGCLMFWLDAPPADYNQGARGFAQTTRFELGEWMARCQTGYEYRMVVGVHPDFPGGKYIRKRLTAKNAFKVHTTLTETCMAAVKSAVEMRRRGANY